jgi:RimJ/RimL family protein N-acetyltransferase
MKHASPLTAHSLKGFRAVLALRTLRNSCVHAYTSDVGQIGIVAQLLWYYRSYRQNARSSDYRVWLFKDQQGRYKAYGALKKDHDGLVLTECVATSSRGEGAGTQVINFLKSVAEKEGMRAVAHINADNIESVGLHEKMGFKQTERNDTSEYLTFIWNPGQ